VTTCARCGRAYKPLRRGYCASCYMRHRRLIGYECGYVDAEPVRQHLKALTAAGIGTRRIAKLAGLERMVVQAILSGCSHGGGRRQPPRKRVSRRTADAILAVPLPDHSMVRDLSADRARVPGVGTARRLQALAAIGWPQRELAARIGWRQSNLSALIAGRPVTAETARKVAALFDELQMVPGPSEAARRRAVERGWVPPLAWDEETIDDPDAQPDLGAEGRVGFVDRYLELSALGLGDVEIASRLGISRASLERQLYRHGLKKKEGGRV